MSKFTELTVEEQQNINGGWDWGYFFNVTGSLLAITGGILSCATGGGALLGGLAIAGGACGLIGSVAGLYK